MKLFAWIGRSPRLLLIGALVLMLSVSSVYVSSSDITDNKSAINRAVLTVSTVFPKKHILPSVLATTGNVSPFQEVVVASEIGNVRLVDVLVDVGDVVKKGQLLARLSSEYIAAELAHLEANVSEAQVELDVARLEADRARKVRAKGHYSEQKVAEKLAAEQIADARLAAAVARHYREQVRLELTKILSPVEGVVSSRSANEGSVAQGGQELFRIIRDGRLEWRAEVSSKDITKIYPETEVDLFTPADHRLKGRVRSISPTVDPETRNCIVYVDVLDSGHDGVLRAGMYVRGNFKLSSNPGLVLPRSSISFNDGLSYVFLLEKNKIVNRKEVVIGREFQEYVEVVSGIDVEDPVVSSGVGFLSDGDFVREVGVALP